MSHGRLVLMFLCLALPLSCGHRVPQQLAATSDGGLDDGPPSTGGRDAAAPDGPLAASTCQYQVLGGPTGVSPASSEVFTPSLAFSGQRFGVAWMRSTGSAHPVIRMRLADRKADLVGQELTAGPESHTWAELAHDGASFGLCWYNDPGMKGRLGFRRISDAGAALGAITSIGSADFGEVCNALVGGAWGWAAVVRGGFQAGGGGWAHRYGLVRLDAAGKPTSPPAGFYPFAEETTRTGLARTDKGYLVAYRAGRKDKLGRIMVQAFDAAGAPDGPAHQLSAAGEHADAPEIVWTGARALVVYSLRDEAMGLQHLTLRPVDAAGQPLAAALVLTPGGTAWAHSAAWTGAELAVSYAWGTGELVDTDKLPPPQHVYLTRLRADGKRLQSDLEVFKSAPGVQLSRTMVRGGPDLIGVSWQQEGVTRQALLAVAGCGGGS